MIIYLLSAECSRSGNVQIILSSWSCGGGVLCSKGGGFGSPDDPACATSAGICGSPDESTGAVICVNDEE